MCIKKRYDGMQACKRYKPKSDKQGNSMYNEINRIRQNIWIEYVYGYITANKAIELLEKLWKTLQ